VSKRYVLTMDDQFVLDTFDCFLEVRRIDTHRPGWRMVARFVCAELNAEHDAAMLAPMQASTVGEDEQTREGKAI
jgi:hypothetical protein